MTSQRTGRKGYAGNKGLLQAGMRSNLEVRMFALAL